MGDDDSTLEQAYANAVIPYLHAHNPRLRLFRQNSGNLVTRDRAGHAIGRVKLLPTGAADYGGWVAPYGIRLEVEFKVDAEHTDEQKQYGAVLTAMGGIYVLLRKDKSLSTEENNTRALRIVNGAINAHTNDLITRIRSL